MIDRDLAALFPPHWLPESRDSALLWWWTDGPPSGLDPVMVLARADGKGHSIIEGFYETGSGLVASDDGLAFRLSAEDADKLGGVSLIFGIWAAGMKGEPDVLGQLVVSDWACEPAKGNA